jgi:hypothetical protein
MDWQNEINWDNGTSSVYKENVLGDQPLAYWRFKDRSSNNGDIVKDDAGEHHGRYCGNVRLQAGIPGSDGSAAGFDGMSYVEIPHYDNFALNRISVELWIKSTQVWQTPVSSGSHYGAPQLPGSATLVTKATPGWASSDWRINAGSIQADHDEGRVIVSSGANRAFADTCLFSGRHLNAGKWHHIVWTRTDKGSNRLYIDGELIYVTSDSGETIANERPIQIGGEGFLENGSFFEGCIAEVAIYDSILDHSRVRTHYETACGGTGDTQPYRGVPTETILLQNNTGLKWELKCIDNGWTLGSLSLHDQLVEAEHFKGVISLHNIYTDELHWLTAEKCEQMNQRTARVSGQSNIDGVLFSFDMEITILENRNGAAFDTRWSVDRDLVGWEVCLSFHQEFIYDWRCQLYPFAGNSESVNVSPLQYCGAPGALLYRADLSLAALFVTDIGFDYLNPTTWTGDTGFHFMNQILAPQFRIGRGKLLANINYSYPLQLFLSDAGNSPKAITEIVQSWLQINDFRVESLDVRTPQEAFELFLKGRRATNMWIPNIGYEMQENCGFVYMKPESAYLDYCLYELTGDGLWRQRCFEQMDWILRAQQTMPLNPHYGVFHTAYNIRDTGHKRFSPAGTFDSLDRTNPGYKVDLNAHMVRYILMTWERVKKHEGLDRQDWYQSAIMAAEWVMRQANADGGLPQMIDLTTNKKSKSVVSHRALPAFPIIARITGHPKYLEFIEKVEQFIRSEVEDRFWFTGSHPDLPPNDYEQDSVWGVVEYWLEKFETTHDLEFLERAVADTYFGLLYWCPKQLSWVDNPTQCAHSEQQNYLQYSVYSYHNKKFECLYRLGRLTGNPFFTSLSNRVMQNCFWTQFTAGPYMGAVSEAIADPWLARGEDYNWRGTAYINELSIDMIQQLLDMGLIKVLGL